MSNEVKAVAIEVHRDPEVPDLVSTMVKLIRIPKNDTLRVMQGVVGGMIEFIPTDDVISIVVDEEGKVKGYPMNVPATSIWHEHHDPYGCVEHGDYIAGTCIFIGPSDRNGNVTDLPEEIREQFRQAAVNPGVE